jgi:hypothetical protein
MKAVAEGVAHHRCRSSGCGGRGTVAVPPLFFGMREIIACVC